jgi:hypothetical protein
MSRGAADRVDAVAPGPAAAGRPDRPRTVRADGRHEPQQRIHAVGVVAVDVERHHDVGGGPQLGGEAAGGQDGAGDRAAGG